MINAQSWLHSPLTFGGGHKGAIIYNTPLGTFGGLSEVTKEDSGLAWNGEPRSSLTAG